MFELVAQPQIRFQIALNFQLNFGTVVSTVMVAGLQKLLRWFSRMKERFNDSLRKGRLVLERSIWKEN